MSVYLRKYGVETKVDFALYETDGTDLKSDAAHASGDTKIMKDEGDEANTTNAFVDEGQGYSITLSAAEMEAARIVVYVVDQGTKAWLDKSLIIETYGHTSAQHAFDLDSATVNLSSASETQIDNIETDTNELQGLIADSKLPVTVKAWDDINLTAKMKADVNAEVDGALNTEVPASNTANSINDLLLDQIDPTVDNIHTDVGTVITNIGDVHATDLPAVKTVVDAIKLKTDNLPTDPADDSDLDTAIAAIATNVTAIKKCQVNKWAIVGTQLIIYDDDGSTPLYTFNLDSATAPTSRTPV
jgi:hypothetical protein